MSRPTRASRRRLVGAAALGVAGLLTVASCSSGGGGASTSGAVRSTPGAGGSGGTAGAGASNGPDKVDARVKLTQVGSVTSPVAMTFRPQSNTLFVAEQAGRVRTLTRATDGSLKLDPGTALDISSEVDGNGERGLLGLAFSRDGQKLYTYFTDKQGTIHVDEYQMRDDRIDGGTRRELLALKHERPNHNGGQLAVGPDGYLYIGVGDGGGGGDPDRNGQNPSTLYGKILRIDPAGSPADDKAYAIPADNPYANGDAGAPEVWTWGLRNPWRFGFDRTTGDLWVADVGQDKIEEIDYLPVSAGAGKGANLGWNLMEGTRSFKGGTPPEGHVPPVLEYGHDNGECSVIGGYVYRGAAVPRLRGVYLYGDFCKGQVRGLSVQGGKVVDDVDLGAKVPQLTSFGQDNDGELYVASQTGPVYRVDPA